MATFVLIHGSGGGAWDWQLVEPQLRRRGHAPVAVDLPSVDVSAGWRDYVDVVVEAVGDRRDLVVVGHSLGGFTAPLVCPRRPCHLLCRDDRMFAASWARAHARARLGVEADEIPGGHYVTLKRPEALAERLDVHAGAHP